MNGIECVMSSSMEMQKPNGDARTVHSSPTGSKRESISGSSGLATGLHTVWSTPDRSVLSRIPEGEEDSDNPRAHCKPMYHACTSSNSIKYLHRTPPSRSKSIVVTNPFDVGITERLHLPMYSPSVFAHVVSPSQDSSTFRWTIEDISRIYPADIEEFPAHQFDEAVDPDVESKAQEAINKFFCKNQPSLPSPWNPRPDSSALRQEVNHGTPIHLQSAPSNSESDSDHDVSVSSTKMAAKEVWTQTTLTLPPVLPPSMELALKPFFTFTQDQQQAQQGASQNDSSGDGEEGILSTSTLRRKLFFHSDSSPAPSTPTRTPQLIGSTSPASFSHSLVQFQGRSFGTPLPGATNLQSPSGISPVHTGTTPMHRVKSATRLDFSQEDMSVDTSLCAAPSAPRQAPSSAQVGSCSPLGTAPLHEKNTQDEESEEQPGMKWVKRNKRNSMNCSSDSMRISQTSTPVKSSLSMDSSSVQQMMDISQTKLGQTDTAWRETDVAYQHDVNSFSYTQHAASSNMLSQDTGYGTRSSCDPSTFQSGASVFGLSLTRDKTGHEDSLATWPNNPSVISSTPTKTLGMTAPEYQQGV